MSHAPATVAAAMPPDAGLPTLRTARLVLRGPRPHDFAPMRDFYASARSRFVGGPRDEGQVWRDFAARWGHVALNGYGLFSVTLQDSDACIGHVGPLFMPGWAEPEISWTLYTGEGRGLAFEAAEAARAHAFRDLGWTTAISYIAPENARSQALARRLGCAPDPDVPHGFDHEVVAWRHPGPDGTPA